VGFQDYDRYLADKQAREEQLRRGAAAQQSVRPPLEQVPANEAEATAAAAVAAVQPTTAQPVAAAPVDPSNPSISDEQDFQAVSSRQSIESDAQRRAAQSQQYTVIAPEALPSRPKNAAPTAIEFALSTNHPVGSKVYRRSGLGAAKAQRACARYRSGELAQDAFLKEGGPTKDKLGLDPDGDGFACSFNPAPYRGLARN
jgi:hypothetical protein